ncbi:MAG: sugar phosphate isomerase/epimerase [Clostridia bacterium]|nr:sugar phosphate isomerase/epimerase [Clostridia bacterium]
MEKRPVAYQVYSAREEAAKDLLNVLSQLKKMGYDGVEFAGFYGHSAAEVKEMLDKAGLVAISSHVPYAQMLEDMEAVIADHKEIGCKYIAIPHLGVNDRPGGPGFAAVIRNIYKFGKMCRENGIQLLYHNHDFEFVTVSGQYGLDFLYDAVCPNLLKTEIDTCWVKYAGEDPAAYVRKYTGRVPVLHLKDYVGRKQDGVAPYGLIGEKEAAENAGIAFSFRPFGYGCQDVKTVVKAGLEAGVEWFVIEQDASPDRPPLEAAAMSIDTLKKLGLKA